MSTCLSGNISLVNHMYLAKYILEQQMFQIEIVKNEACILCLLHFLHKWCGFWAVLSEVVNSDCF